MKKQLEQLEQLVGIFDESNKIVDNIKEVCEFVDMMNQYCDYEIIFKYGYVEVIRDFETIRIEPLNKFKELKYNINACNEYIKRELIYHDKSKLKEKINELRELVKQLHEYKNSCIENTNDKIVKYVSFENEKSIADITTKHLNNPFIDILHMLSVIWYMAEPLLIRDPETRLHIGPDLYKMYLTALANKNIYQASNDFHIFGTNGFMVVDKDLNNTKKIFIRNSHLPDIIVDISSYLKNFKNENG